MTETKTVVKRATIENIDEFGRVDRRTVVISHYDDSYHVSVGAEDHSFERGPTGYRDRDEAIEAYRLRVSQLIGVA